jgi:hypothetical protein
MIGSGLMTKPGLIGFINHCSIDRLFLCGMGHPFAEASCICPPRPRPPDRCLLYLWKIPSIPIVQFSFQQREFHLFLNGMHTLDSLILSRDMNVWAWWVTDPKP